MPLKYSNYSMVSNLTICWSQGSDLSLPTKHCREFTATVTSLCTRPRWPSPLLATQACDCHVRYITTTHFGGTLGTRPPKVSISIPLCRKLQSYAMLRVSGRSNKYINLDALYRQICQSQKGMHQCPYKVISNHDAPTRQGLLLHDTYPHTKIPTSMPLMSIISASTTRVEILSSSMMVSSIRLSSNLVCQVPLPGDQV